MIENFTLFHSASRARTAKLFSCLIIVNFWICIKQCDDTHRRFAPVCIPTIAESVKLMWIEKTRMHFLFKCDAVITRNPIHFPFFQSSFSICILSKLWYEMLDCSSAVYGLQYFGSVLHSCTYWINIPSHHHHHQQQQPAAVPAAASSDGNRNNQRRLCIGEKVNGVVHCICTSEKYKMNIAREHKCARTGDGVHIYEFI